MFWFIVVRDIGVKDIHAVWDHKNALRGNTGDLQGLSYLQGNSHNSSEPLKHQKVDKSVESQGYGGSCPIMTSRNQGNPQVSPSQPTIKRRLVPVSMNNVDLVVSNMR